MPNPRAFEYSLTRRGCTLYFRIKEQGEQLYSEHFLEDINSHLRSKGYRYSVLSVTCPELDGPNIFLRGDEEYDKSVDVKEYGSIYEAKELFTTYRSVLTEIKKYLIEYEDDRVLRKIRDLQHRYDNRGFSSKAVPLPFPKDI